MTEISLPGGRVSNVVRVGDTVRRPTGPWTPAVHGLLRHLESVGYAGAPRVLGVDEQGREVLTFVPGDTVAGPPPWPPRTWTDRSLADAVRLLRDYHEVVASYRPAGVQQWRTKAAPLAADEIVCHNDWAPYNAVWRDDRVVAVIDWDFASPRPASWDVAFALWQWVPLHARDMVDSVADAELLRRARVVVDTYGVEDRGGLVDIVAQRIAASADTISALAPTHPGFAEMVTAGDVANMRRTAERVAELTTAITRALG